MFDLFNEIPPMFTENDEDTLNDNTYITKRKNSFIDLLSYNKSLYDSKFEDVINLDALLDGSTSTEFAEFKPEHPTVQLLIDDFPDISFTSQNYSVANCVKAQQKPPSKVQVQAIGNVSAVERQKKIDRYLEKKKKRTWVKRIHYDCRKKVADNRLRIKGRFVTRNKAFDIINEGGSK